MDTTFDRDTAVRRLPAAGFDAPGQGEDGAVIAIGVPTASFAAEVSPDWRAGRGPHGGYIAAILLRALTETVAEPRRAPRSLTIHYARAPAPGPVAIHTTIERAGRSLSTLSARMEQEGKLLALALAAFSVPWSAPEIDDLPMPEVAPPDPPSSPSKLLHPAAPPFTRHLVLQPRLGTAPFTGADAPMEIGSWLGLADPRPLDALALALFSDALFSPPFIRFDQPAVTPTIDLTIHFREALPRERDPDPHGLCFAHFRSTLVHDGFFEEDGVIWAADGTVLVQSRQLGIVMPLAGHIGASLAGATAAGDTARAARADSSAADGPAADGSTADGSTADGSAADGSTAAGASDSMAHHE
jgi:acyl-CoA thioesterase